MYDLSMQGSDNFIKGINLPLIKKDISTNFDEIAFPEFKEELKDDDILFIH